MTARHRSILCAALLGAASLGAHATTSTFTSGAEGWTAEGDFAAPLDWVATGGNGGGYVEIVDAALGPTNYFVAPTAFLGDRRAAIGSNLTFDLQQSHPYAPSPFDAEDVILQGGGLTIVYDTAANPARDAWTSYAVPLTAAGWKLDDLSGPAVSFAQFSQVMGHLTALKIRAEFQYGPDTGKLDNVALVPEPGTWALLVAGLALLGVMRARKAADR